VLDQSNWGIKFENWGKCGDADPNKCKLPSQEVEDLVKATVGKPNLAKSKAAYVILRVTDYKNSASDHWYIYRSARANWGDPKWDYQKFVGKRIYGSPSVLFIFVHLNANAVTLEAAQQAVSDAKAKNDALKSDLDKAI